MLINLFHIGIGEHDTFSWIKDNDETRHKEVLFWVHSHVNGSLLEFSSIDVHNQHILEEFISDEIIGIVVKLDQDYHEWDAFRLTQSGKRKIEKCSKKNNLADVQHPKCEGTNLKHLFSSCRDWIEESSSGSVKLFDFRNDDGTINGCLIQNETHFDNHEQLQTSQSCSKSEKRSKEENEDPYFSMEWNEMDTDEFYGHLSENSDFDEPSEELENTANDIGKTQFNEILFFLQIV